MTSEPSVSSRRSYLLPLIPWVSGGFALFLAVAAYGGGWPDWKIIPAFACLGVFAASKDLL